MGKHAYVHGTNKEIVGIWFQDPAEANPEMIATAIEWGLSTGAGGSPATNSDQINKLMTIGLSNYRIVPNNFDDKGGCFVMFGATLAPGEKPGMQVNKIPATHQSSMPAQSVKNFSTAMALEIILGLLGILGSGWIYSGNTTTGIILLVCYLIWDCLAIAFVLGSSGAGLICTLPLGILAVIVSSLFLNTYSKKHPEIFGNNKVGGHINTEEQAKETSPTSEISESELTQEERIIETKDIERGINELINNDRIKDLKIYLFNDDPQTRKISVELMANIQYAYVSQLLCDLLGDNDEGVRETVYKVTWIREKNSNCEYIIKKLKDEIEYGSYSGMLGPAKAKQAVKKLLEFAPDQDAKDGILEHIDASGLSYVLDQQV